MEERHGQIADVIGGELIHLGQDRADPGQAALAAQAGLGGARGARREEEQSERLLGHPDRLLIRKTGTGHSGQQGGVRGGPSRVEVAGGVVDHQDPLGWK